jgi:intracellular sulfur oxidation DsrE/DsrF family protein
MSITNRRGFLGALAVSGATLAASRAGAAPDKLDLSKLKKDTDVACVYHCDFGDPQRFGQLITNMNNHLSVYEYDTMRVKLVIVAHAAGLKFFLDDLSGTPWANDKIDPDLYKRFTGLTTSGVATVAELQGKGFAYLKVG